MFRSAAKRTRPIALQSGPMPNLPCQHRIWCSVSTGLLPVLLVLLLSPCSLAQDGAEDVARERTDEYASSDSNSYTYDQYDLDEYDVTGYPFAADSTLGSDRTTYQATFPKVEEPELFRAEYTPEGEYRQPSAICFASPQTALISTKRGGNVYELSWPSQELGVAWNRPNAEWGDIVRIDNNLIAIAERSKNQIHIFANQDEHWKQIDTLSAPGFPHTLRFDPATDSLLATGQWSQRLYRWKLDQSGARPTWKMRETLALPMCGGQLLALSSVNKILVMDAFGRQYAVVDEKTFEVVHEAEVYGHNIAGLATTANETMVFFPHQLLNEIARSERTDITWGGLMSNNIRWLKTERLLSMQGEDIFRQGKFYPLGTPGNGAGDPSSMAVSSDYRIAVTLAGTNRVTIGRKEDYYFKQVDVGYRPVDCVFSPDESQLIVVNQFSDSLTVVDLDELETKHLSLGKLRPPTEKERGEQLFFSAALAHDRWMSCHSCHSNGHSNGQLNDNKSDHTFGTPKRVLSLLGQAETGPYAWGGNMPSIADQVAHSVTSTMAGGGIPPEAVRALTAFVESLPPAPSLIHARQESEMSYLNAAQLVTRGQKIFAAQGCAHCHAGKQYTSSNTYDVGIHDEQQMTNFNPPSLSGVSQRENMLFHDGRARSLMDVVSKEKHQLQTSLSDEDAVALIHFLQSL